MRYIHSFLLSSALLAGLTSFPGAREGQDPQPPVSKSARASAKRMLAEMQGAWRLVDMQLATQGTGGFVDRELERVGYCLIHGKYLSLEFHLRLVDKTDNDLGRSFVTGLHRIELDGAGRMETTTVIATSTNLDGVPSFEAPGANRRYEIEFLGEHMVMKREDGHRLEFERLIDKEQRFDIFGRPVREKEDASESGDGKEGGGSGGGHKKD